MIVKYSQRFVAISDNITPVSCYNHRDNHRDTHLGDGPEHRPVLLREEGDGLARPARPPGPAYSVDVGNLAAEIMVYIPRSELQNTHGGGREVVVDDEVDPLEVDAAAHELGADEDPDGAAAEGAHRVVALLLGPLAVDHVHVDAVIQQLLEQLASTLLRLRSVTLTVRSGLIINSLT